MATPTILPLICGIQNYAWGKNGNDGEVAQLGVAGGHLKETANEKPYAELWMGSHPSCPSRFQDGKLLATWLQENGSQTGQLSYLFKVLSVRTALSVQVHPNKAEAEKLHAARPDLYPDPNHKPEMAIALTPFEMMAFFRPAKRIAQFCRQYGPLGKMLGDDVVSTLENSSDADKALKEAYARLFKTPDDAVKSALSDLVAHISIVGRGLTTEEGLFLRLNQQYPGDVGCFSPFFLNCITLKPGEAIFLEANMPHAYIDGDCMECMACSDNVIRAGLTPKYKDIEALLTHVNYNLQVDGAGKLCKPSPIKPNDQSVVEFVPPVPDFKIVRFETTNKGKVVIGPFKSHAIFVVIKGSANLNGKGSVKRGSIYFMSSGSQASFEAIEDLSGFAAMSNE